MFCKFCGNQLTEGAAFCPSCGNPIEADAEQNQATNETQVLDSQVSQEAEQNTQPLEVAENHAPADETQVLTPEEQPYFAQPQFNVPPKKSGKKLPIIIAAVVAVFVVAAILAVSFFGPLQGVFLRTFGSDADYFRYVEKKTFDVASDEIADIYGNAFENIQSSAAGDMTLKLNVGKSAITLLENAFAASANTSIDLDWLNTVAIDLDVNVKDDVEQLLAALNINGKTVVDADLIINMAKGEVFMGLPALTDKYLSTKIEDSENYTKISSVTMDPELKKALPSDDEINALINKYIAVIVESIDNVTASSENVMISGITQKLEVLKVTIDAKEANDIALAVLNTVKADKELKAHIETFTNYLEKKALITDAKGAVEDFYNAVDDAVKEVKSDDGNGDGTLILTDYVNSEHEVVGRKIESNGQELVYYTTVRDGDNFAYQLKSSGAVITGEGTEVNDIINATYALSYNNLAIGEIVVSDIDTDNDVINGKIRLIPSAALLEQIGLDKSVATALSIANPELEFSFDGDKDSGKVDISLISGKEIFVGLSLTTEQTDASAIKEPSSQNVIDAEKADEWTQTININEVLERLEQAGISMTTIAALLGSF